MDTYRFVVEENEEHAGLDVDVYGEDGTIVEATQVAYDDHGFEVRRPADWEPDRWEREVTADVRTLEILVESRGGFTVDLVGDGETLASIRIEARELGAESAG